MEAGSFSSLRAIHKYLFEDIYGFEVSEAMVTAVTNKILPQIEEWQQRPLSTVYPIVFIDAIHFSVRDEHIVKKIAAYIILGINDEGKKEVLSITVGENESAKYAPSFGRTASLSLSASPHINTS